MPSFNDHPVSSRVKLLLAGDSGDGKTGGLADLANKGFKVHILDMDRGLDILAEYLDKSAVSNVDYVTLNPKDSSLLETEKGKAAISKVWDDARIILFKNWDGTGKSVYDWGPEDVLVIDSATFLCDACHAVVLAEHGVKPDAAKYDRGLWTVTTVRFEALIAELMDDNKVKCNVVLTSHLRNIEDEKTGIMRTFPSFLGQKLPNAIPRHVNNFWRVTKKDGKLIYKTASDGKLSLKSTMPSIIKAEETRGLGELFKLVTSAAANKQG